MNFVLNMMQFNLGQVQQIVDLQVMIRSCTCAMIGTVSSNFGGFWVDGFKR